MSVYPSDPWSELTPAGGDSINAGDNKIRQAKTQIREVIDVDHDFPSSGQAADVGQHKRVTLQEQADLGTGATGVTILGGQTIAGKPELVYTDEDNNDIQITSVGIVKTTDTVKLSGDQTVGGIKTFSSSPIVPEPTTDMQSATKKYVDDNAGNKIDTIPTGPTNGLIGVGGYNYGPTTSGQYYYMVIGTDSNGKVKIVSGIGAAGSTIPLPVGCAQENCSWIISVKYVVCSYGFAGLDTYISSSRAVTIYCYGVNWVG